MERVTKFRAMVFLGLFLMVLVLFSFKLFSLQIIETDGNTDNTTTYTSLTTVKAARGDITDRNGTVLVGNRASYDLVFNHYVIESTDGTNEYLYRLVKKCQELGAEYNDHFPVTKERPFEYTLDDYSTAWRNYFQSFMRDWEIDSDISASLLVQTLRTRYEIPETWSDEEARAVVGMRYEFDLRGVANLSNYVFIEDVSDAYLSALLELNTPGLMVESSTVREVYTDYAAHILGYVGSMTPEQWETFKTQNYSMDAMVGQAGLELAFEDELHAIDGTRVDVVDKYGTIIKQYYANIYDENKKIIGQKTPKAGNNVELTIDIELQKVVEDELAKMMLQLTDPDREVMEGTYEGQDAEGAAAIMMEVKTGDILACASYPTFKLSTMKEDWEELNKDPLTPLFNRAIQAVYPPGSTYKMTTLIAAMNNNLINMETEIRDQGVFTKYDFNRSCLLWTSAKVTHGTIDAAKAIEVSCNYFFYELGDMLGIYQMDEVAKGLGLGEPTGIELDEKVGWRANEESKKKQYTGLLSQWFVGDRILAAIGQSENRFSPMQLCVYACTLANRGTRMKATFLNRVVSSDYRTLVFENQPEVMSQLEICNDAYVSYMNGMRQVITGNAGTARKYFNGFNDEEHTFHTDVTVWAKTGTSETFSNVSDHGAFICFAGRNETPEVAIAIFGEQIAHGSTAAVVAEAVLQYYFSLDKAGDVPAYENQLS